MKNLKLDAFRIPRRKIARRPMRLSDEPTTGEVWRDRRNDAIACLSRQEPGEWDIPTLAFVFDLDPSTIRKILKTHRRRETRSAS